jgi:hypothetical protein
MTEDEYEQHLDAVIAAIAAGELPSAEQIATQMLPDHPKNSKVLKALKNLKQGITVTALEKALAKKAVRDNYDGKIKDLLGVCPQTERQMVSAFITHGQYRANYACEFIDPTGKLVKREDLLRDIQLTAADLRLTKKPLELRDKNFERALQEWCGLFRQTRLNDVLAMIDAPLNADDRTQIEREMLTISGYYFKEAAFALASVQTVMWEIKRKMRGIDIPEPLFTVLYGKQRGGKSSFWRLVTAIIRDMCKTVDVTALVSDSMLDLYLYFVIDTDEMAKADRACLAKLKNTVSTQKISRRIYYTQTITDVPMLATLIGSSNVPVKTLIQDPTGMRRFNQLDVKPRSQVEPHWQAIQHADWLGLWRTVDAKAESPMMPFMDLLSQKQETMRTVDRVESWLNYFEFDARSPSFIKTSLTGTSVQYTAMKLYELFSLFEGKAFPGGNKMTLGNWGTRLQALIDEGGVECAQAWDYDTHGRRTIYTHTLPNVVSIGYQQAS